MARKVGSVAETCRRTGLSRREVEDAVWELDGGGPTALRAHAERVVRRRPDYIATLEDKVAEVSRRNPTWGRKKIASCLTKVGYPASPSRVRRVLLRCGLMGDDAALNPAVMASAAA